MKKILILLLLVALLLPLVSCGKTREETEVETTAPETAAQTEPGPEEPEELKCTVRPAALGNAVPIHTALQAAYLADSVFSVNDYAGGKEEFSYPDPVVLTWDVDFESGENALWYFVVRIWTAADKSDERAFLVGGAEREYRFYNAYIGQRYHWNVTAYGTGGESIASDASSFKTESTAPRNLMVDGVINVRDLGGRKTEDGGVVRQGLLFRGAKLHNADDGTLITDAGIATMRQTLGIKSEMDLRTESEIGTLATVLGDGVNYYFRNLKASLDITDSTLRGHLKKIFAILADENNYPIYYHCAAGADRTGMVSWLVNGLCGVSEDDLWRDYLLTNFAGVGGERKKSNIDAKYVTPLKNATGANLAQKIYNYLKNDVGIPAANLDAVIRIMKAAPGEAVTYTMPTVPAGHTHTPTDDYTVVGAATCTTTGVKVKYCATCGEFLSDTVAAIPVDPDAHQADWNVVRQPTLTDQADGSRNGTCTLCGKYVEETVSFAPTTLTFTDQSSGSYKSEKVYIADGMQGKHFYPTASDPEGNDLYIEYSLFYHRTIQNLDAERNPYATTRLSAESVLFWSPVADIPDSWCKYAGGFEGTGDNFMNPVSDSEVTTPANMVKEAGVYPDYPNIGGDDPDVPAFGWHRIGLRIHEEVTNASALKKDTTAGATAAKYRVTLTVYFDGVPVYKLKTDDSTNPMRSKYDLLFTAASDGKGGIVYTDIGEDRYVIPFHLNATTAKSGKNVYVAIADVSVSCGKSFIQKVEKLSSPTASTITFPTGTNLSAPIFYRVVAD